MTPMSAVGAWASAPRAQCGRRRAAPSGAGRSSPADAGAERRRPAASGWQRAGHHLEQGRLAGAVLAHDAQRSPRRTIRRGLVDHPVAVGLLDEALDLDDVVAAALGRGTRSCARRCGAGARPSRSCRASWPGSAPGSPWRGWALKRSMKRMSLASMACWRSYSASRRAASRARARLVEVVVAGVAAERAAVDLDDLRTTRFITSRSWQVMSTRRGSRAATPLEPEDRLDVEVVGGLVEQERGRGGEQHAGQLTRIFQPPERRADVAVDLLGRKPRPARMARARAVQVVAAASW
jgi:hypothetical protein